MATSSSKAESIGRWLGRSWRSVARQDAYAARWMMDQGTPPLVAKSLLWIVKLAIVAILLYVAFWFVVLLMLAIAVAALLGTVMNSNSRIGSRSPLIIVTNPSTIRSHTTTIPTLASRTTELVQAPESYSDAYLAIRIAVLVPCEPA